MSISSGVNRVFLLGHIVGEPEFKTIDDEYFLCFQLVTSEIIKKAGQSHELLEWHSILMAYEIIKAGPELRDGDALYIQGKLRTIKLLDGDIKRYKTQILATSIEPINNLNK